MEAYRTGSMRNFDVEDLYNRSFQALDWIYKADFKKSLDYKKLVQEMNENMIEYRFFSLAGLQQHKNSTTSKK